MLTAINNISDVHEFMYCLVREGVNAHPDEDFDNYVNIETGEATYSSADAALRNRLMERSFEVCDTAGKDIYGEMHEIFLTATGLDKYVPLPSAAEENNSSE